MTLLSQSTESAGTHKVITINEGQVIIESDAIIGTNRDAAVDSLYALAYHVKTLHAETANVIITFFYTPILMKGLKDKVQHILKEVIDQRFSSYGVNIDLIYALDPSYIKNIHELVEQPNE